MYSFACGHQKVKCGWLLGVTRAKYLILQQLSGLLLRGGPKTLQIPACCSSDIHLYDRRPLIDLCLLQLCQLLQLETTMLCHLLRENGWFSSQPPKPCLHIVFTILFSIFFLIGTRVNHGAAGLAETFATGPW